MSLSHELSSCPGLGSSKKIPRDTEQSSAPRKDELYFSVIGDPGVSARSSHMMSLYLPSPVPYVFLRSSTISRKVTSGLSLQAGLSFHPQGNPYKRTLVAVQTITLRSLPALPLLRVHKNLSLGKQGDSAATCSQLITDMCSRKLSFLQFVSLSPCTLCTPTSWVGPNDFRKIGQQVRCLLCTQVTQDPSLAQHMFPQALPGVILEHRARNKP